MSSSSGTKVTTDPQSLSDPKNENPGTVLSDSLAAESIQSGGSFAANSDSRGPMGQSSAGTTTNTIETSGATELPPASSADARSDAQEAQEGWGEESKLNAGSSLGSSNSSGGSYASAAGGSDENVAPQGSTSGESQKPKGTNLQEGGFSSDDPNASFTTDIGGKDDPGRAALEELEARNAESAGGEGTRKYGKAGGEGQFDALGGDSSA